MHDDAVPVSKEERYDKICSTGMTKDQDKDEEGNVDDFKVPHVILILSRLFLREAQHYLLYHSYFSSVVIFQPCTGNVDSTASFR